MRKIDQLTQFLLVTNFQERFNKMYSAFTSPSLFNCHQGCYFLLIYFVTFLVDIKRQLHIIDRNEVSMS